MEKRVLLAVFLSFLVLYVYQTLFVKPAPRRPVAPPTAARQEAEQRAAPAVTQGAPAPAPMTGPPVETVIADTQERDLVVETTLVRAVFTNRGATLKSWALLNYRDLRNRPVELVPSQTPPGAGRPFSLETPDKETTARLNQGLFRISAPSPLAERVDATRQPAAVTFEYQDATGLRATKTFELQPASYAISFSASVTAGGSPINPTVNWGPALGDVGSGETSRYTQKAEGILFRDQKVQRLNPGAIAKQPVHEGNAGWAGVDDQYFISVLVHPRPLRVRYEPVIFPGSQPDSPTHTLIAYGVTLPQPPASARFFVGPKDFDVLAAIDRDLVRAINFGWFAWLCVPLLRSLKWINGYVGNYGWSIIILTIIINAAMFPLRHKSVVAMRKMQELQPEVKAIQDRYAKLKATDPARQKMNVELMNLYRERGANPASGCIPMLLTMPVLFAFYSLLSQAIEIRGAPFMLWIKDLSAHDPLYVTPILMGATMVVQQKMTPSTADPAQQRMMTLMPIVFTFMFLWAPSGLVLYWLVSNVWAIGQQHITNRLIGPPVVRVIRPPAERQLKKAGAGKTDKAKAADHGRSEQSDS